MKGGGEVFHLRHSLDAARTAAVGRLDDKIAAAFDGDALQFLRRADFGEPGHRHAGRDKAFLHRQLVAGQLRHMDRQSRQAQALRHRRRCDRGVGGDTDHAVDLANLAVIAFGGGGGFRGAIDIGDQAGIGQGKARRMRIAVRDHHGMAQFLGALDGVHRFDAAGDDQNCFSRELAYLIFRHQK